MNIPISIFNLYEILTGKMEPKPSSRGAIIYNPKFLIINLDKLNNFYARVPQISTSVFLIDVKHIIAMSGKYMPVYYQNKNLLYTQEEYLEYSKRVRGFITHPTGPYVFSEKLDFPGMEKYLEVYDQNEKRNRQEDLLASNSIKEVIERTNAKALPLFKSKRITNYRVVNTGSTSRNTNIPGSGSDFDYIVQFSYKDEADRDKKVSHMIDAFIKAYHLKPSQMLVRPFRLRIFGLNIPGIPEPADVDISFIGANQEYFSTDEAMRERLTVMRMQDELLYRKAVANIQYAKEVLKTAEAYKTHQSRREQSGLGGIGIENWILQYGGSFIEAAESFVNAAFMPNGELKPFIEFEKEYSVMDCGLGHVNRAKGQFALRNFVICHMRENGYEKMAYALKKQLEIIREGNRAR